MEYVTKKAVLEVIEKWQRCFCENEQGLIPGTAVTNILKDDVLCMECEIDTEIDITELLFREKREPIKVRDNLALCPTCRKQLKDGHSYCKKCGQAILRKKVEAMEY